MKRVWSLCMLLCLSTAVFGQSAVRFGFTTSPGITWMTPDNKNISSDGARFGFSYGAIVDFTIDDNDRYFITSGMNLALNGGKLIGTQPDGPGIASLVPKVQYLELPVGLKLRTNETASNITFYGVLGLVNGFRVRARANHTYTGFDNETELPIVIDETNVPFKNLKFYPVDAKRINVWQLSLQFEAGAEFRVAENTAIVGGLYFRNGFTNMVKNDDSERTVGRHLGLRVAVMF
jgi:hypothetical protein